MLTTAYNEVSKKYNKVSMILFNDQQRLVGEWTRNSRHAGTRGRSE